MTQKSDHNKIPVGQAISLVLSLVLGLTGMVFLWSALFGSDGLRQYNTLQDQLETLQQSLQQAEEENERLRGIIDKLRANEQSQKDAVRDGLGYLERNEVILVPTEEQP